MSTRRFKPPIAVHLIWHQSDDAIVTLLRKRLEKLLMRDTGSPFSRFANIPLYYYSTKDASLESSLDLPMLKSGNDVVIVLLSPNFIGARGGIEYLSKLSAYDAVVPVWLEAGVGRSGVDSFDSINAVRLYDYPKDDRDRWGALLISHEILRRCLTVIDKEEKGKTSSLTLFLSHAKADVECEKLVVRVKSLIQQTNLSQFYDKTEISPGFLFNDEIDKYIKGSTVIAFRGCQYSSRYWCQKEILSAKAHDRPIVICDMLNGYEDRGFPALSNIPSIRIDNSEVGDKEVLDLLILAVRETIRCRYAEAFLSQWADLCGLKCKALVRPPEPEVIIKSSTKGLVSYFDPPLFEDELEWCKSLGIDVITPLYNPNSDTNSLNGLFVGISASDPTDVGFGHFHVNGESWKLLAQDIGRHTLVRSGNLVYGGDMRQGGVTEFLLEEASRLRDRPEFNKNIRPIVNYLSWPIHLKEDESVKWRNRFAYLLDSRYMEPAASIGNRVDAKSFIAPTTDENSFIWSICLSDMRVKMIDQCDVRICIGGRTSDYKGIMPGVLEEVMIALQKEKPLLLLGGFGGLVGSVCDIIRGKAVDVLSRDWQIGHTRGYSTLLTKLKESGVDVDYDKMISRLREEGISRLASRCGLTEDEYRVLMESEYVEECTYLVNKSLTYIKKAKDEASNGK